MVPTKCAHEPRPCSEKFAPLRNFPGCNSCSKSQIGTAGVTVKFNQDHIRVGLDKEGISQFDYKPYMASLLENIRNCLSSTYFCGLCLKNFKKSEEILPHMSAFHKSFVSNEAVEQLRNAREARRRQESEDQLRTRHSNNHSECDTCFILE